MPQILKRTTVIGESPDRINFWYVNSAISEGLVLPRAPGLVNTLLS